MSSSTVSRTVLARTGYHLRCQVVRSRVQSLLGRDTIYDVKYLMWIWYRRSDLSHWLSTEPERAKTVIYWYLSDYLLGRWISTQVKRIQKQTKTLRKIPLIELIGVRQVIQSQHSVLKRSNITFGNNYHYNPIIDIQSTKRQRISQHISRQMSLCTNRVISKTTKTSR
jgi:hypothetical protein